MSAEQKLTKQTELLNRLVIDRRTADEVGRVDQLWLVPQSHLVMGFSCKSGFLGKNKRAFSWAQIESIGADSIMVNTSADAIDPEKSDAIISLIGHEVWTESGNKVGKLVDYLLVPQTGTVVYYLFSSSGWRGVMEGIYLLPPEAVSSAGIKRVIVKDDAVLNPRQYAAGLTEKVGQAAEYLQEDYEKTVDHWENLKRRTQAGTEGVKRGAQQLAEELQERAQEVQAQVQTRRHNPSQPPAIEPAEEVTIQPSKEQDIL